MDIAARWEEVRAEVLKKFGVSTGDQKLKGMTAYVSTLHRRGTHQVGGRVFLVPALHAARVVVDGTHDYSSPEEIEAYESDQLLRSRAIRETAQEEDQKFKIVLSPEMVRRMGAPGSAAGK